MQRLKQFIEQLPSLTSSEKESAFALFQPRSLKKNEHLLRAGEICSQNTYVLKGCLRIYSINDHQKESIIQFAFEDFWMGDLNSFFNRTPSVENIQALEDCELAVISRDNFIYLMETYPIVKEVQLQKITRSYTTVTKKMADDRLISAEQRYVELMKQHPEIIQRIPQQYIAQYLGIEAPSLSRIKKRIAGK